MLFQFPWCRSALEVEVGKRPVEVEEKSRLKFIFIKLNIFFGSLFSLYSLKKAEYFFGKRPVEVEVGKGRLKLKFEKAGLAI